jgi:hypothetical protein
MPEHTEAMRTTFVRSALSWLLVPSQQITMFLDMGGVLRG